MRVLFFSSEVAPYSKTGGLGDVAGALPRALAALGHDVRVVTPLYRSVSRERLVDEKQRLHLTFPFGSGDVRFWSTPIEQGHGVVFVECGPMFDRPSLYGYPDDARRFATFAMAGLSWAQATGFDADVVWGNDWQSGLIPLALRTGYAHTPLGAARTMFTIHNLAYQGNFDKSELDALGIPWSWFGLDGVEFYGHLGFMKAGLQLSEVLTTVSPSYAEEIQTHEGGVGLDGVLRSRRKSLHGILNGIDVNEWNPATDVLLPARFTANDLSGKAHCRQALLTTFGLDAPLDGLPVFGAVGRMVDQKGADLMQVVVPRLLERGAAVVILGSGDTRVETGWRELAARYPRRLGLRIGFDNSLAHLIEAGSDFFLMPSRFEPCGLNQMYSLVYGAVPIVRSVGGLKDTVTDYSNANGNGVVFGPASAEALLASTVRAVELYRDAPNYRRVQQTGMRQDFSWQQAAKAYQALFSR